MLGTVRAATAAFVLVALAACGTPNAEAPAPAPGADAVTFVPATPEQGAAILAARDEYTTRLTPADLSIRLRGEPGDAATLGRLYAGETQAWTPEEIARLEGFATRHRAALNALGPWLPDTIYLIKGTRRIEGGLPHTRGAAIYFGPALPGEADTSGSGRVGAAFDGLFFHELFHVLSRANRNRADEIYGIIGFEHCEAVLPQATTDRMITNPDAPTVLHAARVSESDANLMATPLLVANPPRYDAARPNLNGYFGVEITPLRRGADGKCRPAEGVTMTQEQLAEAIFVHAGRNTNYMFHPEELMADNFAQMMLGADVPDEWVHVRLAALLGVPQP